VTQPAIFIEVYPTDKPRFVGVFQQTRAVHFARPEDLLTHIRALEEAFDKAWPEYAVDRARAWPNA
jgi:hypothetical protein